ncbi:MAG: septum formation initiator family protein [Clostridiales bacterium]|nr:septum formation initiator family protein [Clostridiales bacterium]
MKKITRKHNGISFLTAIMFVSFIVFGVLCVTRFYDLKKQHDRLSAESADLDRQKAALEEELMQIRKEANSSDNKAYIESVARTHLDMVYPEEIIFHVAGDND